MKRVRLRIRLASWWRRRPVRIAAAVAAVPVAALIIATAYYYVSFARLIDTRLHGERDRVLPRVFARPLELRRGQSLTERQLVDRLNDIGYAERAHPDKPGQFSIGAGCGRDHAAQPRAQGSDGPRGLSASGAGGTNRREGQAAAAGRRTASSNWRWAKGPATGWFSIRPS